MTSMKTSLMKRQKKTTISAIDYRSSTTVRPVQLLRPGTLPERSFFSQESAT